MKLYQAIYLRVFFLLILFILFVQIGYAKPQIHNNVFNATSKSGSVLVEILLNENISQNEVIVDLQSMDNGFNMIQKRYSPRSIVANITAEGLEKLSADGRVSRVDVIRSTNLHLAESRQVIKSTYINDNLAYKGRGATACIIDTGIDVDNSHFSGKIVDEACFCLGDGIKGCCPNSLPSQFGPGAAQDDHGHGTHISGIVAADGWFTKGIAPEATLLVAKACNKDMTCTFPDLQDAVSWCMNKITTPTKEVITLSNGVGIFGSSQYCDNEYLGFLIGQAYNLGIPVVASSGNNGSLNGITFPACSSGAISVGSTYDDTFLRKPLIGDWEGANCHDSFIQPDNVSCYTNRHEILDLLAPGCDIKSTGLNSLFRESKCGTSMASPHVAAAILLLQEAARGTLSPLEIRERLKESGKIIHDTSNSRDNGPPSGLWFPRLDILAAFQLDWPTYQHDNRRTGFTLLKGDMQNSKDVEQLDFLFRVGGTEDLFSRSVVSDIDGDDDLETVFFSVYGTPEHPEGWLFVIETDKEGKILRENKIGELFVGDAANGPPIVANTDDDAEKEIVVGLANGTVYLIDAQPSGDNLQLSKHWSYTVPAHYSEQLSGWARGSIGIGIVAQDLDYDGRTEIIFTDELSTTVDDWDGGLYVLRDNGNTYAIADTMTIGNGGSKGGVSVANLDDDDNLEIIVSTYYGIKVFDFANNELQLKWANSFGVMEGAPVVYDYDRDNTYEILVSTTSYYCSVYRSCADTFYAFDGATGNLEKITGLGFHSPTTVALANLDQDTNTEAALSFRYDPEEELGGVVCIDIQGQRIDCEYTNGGTFHSPNIAPVIADIDGNGDNEIIIPENNKSILHVINGDGTQLFNYSFGGLIGSSPAIADIDDDGRAEIVVKRAGSPYSIMATLGSNNHQPYLEPMKPVIAIAGQAASLQANASDPDNDTLTLYYSAPFNETGQWLPTNNDTGDYTILVEASDGNLSHHQYVPIKVLPEGTQVINVFADGSFNKTLVFTEPGQVQRVTIKIPKKAQLIYGTMKIEGKPVE